MGPGFNSMIRQGSVNNSQHIYNKELAQGARSGQLNRNEFMSLTNFDQQTRQMEGQFLKDGQMSANEKSILDQRMAYSRQMMDLYKKGDFQPMQQMPMNQIEARQQNQMNRIYSGLRDGSLANGGIFGGDEGARAMDRVGDISTNYGKAQMGGFLSPESWGGLNNQLDNSSANIFNLRHNWMNGPACPLPDNVSFGGFGGFMGRYW